MTKNITILFSFLTIIIISSCGADKCPGEEVCGSGCMPTGSSCCADGAHYCDAPAVCTNNLCYANGGDDPTGTYYVSANGCTGYYSTVSYRGNDYSVCNAYYQIAVAAACTKILDNCR